MSRPESPDEEQYGFRWGPVVVQRTASYDRGSGECRILRVIPDVGPPIELYISPTGRSVRVFRDHVELKPEVKP